MADRDLDTLLNTLPLSSTEEDLLNIPSEELAAGLDMCNRSLIGKFQAREEVIIQNFKSDMISAWESDFFTINLRKNVYQFIFESEDKLNQIIDNGPWCFDGNLVVLRKWRDDWESCKFDESDEFWVHIVGLPLKYYISSVGKRLISLFKGCKKVEIREEEVSGKRFFRLRIRVNILEPFRRVILLSSDNGKSCSRGLIQYERLPNLCYVCGLCDHSMNACDVSKGEVAESELPFGPWLNADRKSSLLDEIELDGGQPKVVELENKKVKDEPGFVEGTQPWVKEGQPKKGATNDAQNQTTEESKTARFEWRIVGFSHLNVKKIYSDVFVVGGYKWRVLLYPKGSKLEYLSVYLVVEDAASLPKGWSQNVHFSLAVVDRANDGTKNTLKKEVGHLFNQTESGWGFPLFMPLSRLNDPNNGFVYEDTVIIEADLDLREDPDTLIQ